MTPRVQRRVAEIEAREKTATRGPWELGECNDVRCDVVLGDVKLAEFKNSFYSRRDAVENALFSTHARADIPFLLDLVKRQADEIALRDAEKLGETA